MVEDANVFLQVLAEALHVGIPLAHALIDGVPHSRDGRAQRDVDGKVLGRGGDAVLLDQLVHLRHRHCLLIQDLDLTHTHTHTHTHTSCLIERIQQSEF